MYLKGMSNNSDNNCNSECFHFLNPFSSIHFREQLCLWTFFCMTLIQNHRKCFYNSLSHFDCVKKLQLI